MADPGASKLINKDTQCHHVAEPKPAIRDAGVVPAYSRGVGSHAQKQTLHTTSRYSVAKVTLHSGESPQHTHRKRKEKVLEKKKTEKKKILHESSSGKERGLARHSGGLVGEGGDRLRTIYIVLPPLRRALRKFLVYNTMGWSPGPRGRAQRRGRESQSSSRNRRRSCQESWLTYSCGRASESRKMQISVGPWVK